MEEQSNPETHCALDAGPGISEFRNYNLIRKMYVDKLFSEKVRHSLNEPVYQGFDQQDVNAYFSSLKKLILGPLVTIGLTAGAGAIWSYFTSQPASIFALLKSFTNLRENRFSANPFGTRSKVIHTPTVDSLEEKAKTLVNHEK